ncbi:MAG: hypothetical protein GXP42_08325 [Chloroflexi bacterium]|nr:hypothetical protein [Chloroflexota bacterium]
MFHNKKQVRFFGRPFGGFIRSLLLGCIFTLALTAHVAARGAISPERRPHFQPTPVPYRGDGLVVGVKWEGLSNAAEAGLVHVIYNSKRGLTSRNSQVWAQVWSGLPGTPEDSDQFGAALAVGDFNGDGHPDLAIGIPGETVNGRDGAGAVQVIYGTLTGLTAANNQLWHQDVSGIPGAAEAGDKFGYAVAAGDFDGDGFDDLAIGIPGEDIGSMSNAGAVLALYGSAQGLTANGAEDIYQGYLTVESAIGDNEFFGVSLVAGDFNGDDRMDLAIGVPGEEVNGASGAGAVHLFYGQHYGLMAPTALPLEPLSKNELWHQYRSGVHGWPETHDAFGTVLTSGDFNGDDVDDLAVGIPLEDVGSVVDAGAVAVLYGASTGISAAGNQLWDQNSPGMPGVSEKDDGEGLTLTAGDFDGDGYEDLAIGWISEDNQAGGVSVLYGDGNGLSDKGIDWLDQGTANVPGDPGPGNAFGSGLTAGDFDRDGIQDLAVGVPGERVNGISRAGQVFIFPGSGVGLLTSNIQVWSQDSDGIDDAAEFSDWFGQVLATYPHSLAVNCTTDAYEPNDFFSTAYDAASDFQQFGGFNIYDDAYICPYDDVDYYRFPVTAGETIHASLASLPEDYFMALYDPDRNLVAWSTNNGLQDENITYTATRGGDFFLKVAGSGDETWDDLDGYSLQLYTEAPSPGGCADSAYEPNDDYQSAASITPGQQVEAYICDASDQDWFRFDATAGQQITAILSSLPADYDLDLYDPSGTLVERSQENGLQDEQITHTAQISGAYRVRIFGYQGAYDKTDSYLLNVTLGSGSGGKTFLPMVRK